MHDILQYTQLCSLFSQLLPLFHIFIRLLRQHASFKETQINVCSMFIFFVLGYCYSAILIKQVCGNSEHVRFLSEWLKGWDERGHKTGAATRDTNDSSYQDESDADYSDDASDCDNVLLITGPVGVSATLTNTCHLNCMFHLNVFYLGFFCVFSDASSFFFGECVSERISSWRTPIPPRREMGHTAMGPFLEIIMWYASAFHL